MAVPPGGQRVDWSVQTAARAKPARPDGDDASLVSCGLPFLASASGGLEPGERAAEAPPQVRDEPFKPRLRLAHREVAVRLPGAGDRVRPHLVQAEREADLLQSLDDFVDALLRDAGDDEVLLPRDANVPAERRGEVGDRDHLVTGDEAEADR